MENETQNAIDEIEEYLNASAKALELPEISLKTLEMAARSLRKSIPAKPHKLELSDDSIPVLICPECFANNFNWNPYECQLDPGDNYCRRCGRPIKNDEMEATEQ